jgi:hypothetical protein
LLSSLSPQIMQPGYVVDQSPVSIAEVKNAWK